MSNYYYDLKKLKEQITPEQVFDILQELDAEPYWEKDTIVALTVCHGGDAHKLIYYSNTGLARCYTQCSCYMDIFEVVRKALSQVSGSDINLFQAANYVVKLLGIKVEQASPQTEAWSLLKKYDRITQESEPKEISLKIRDDKYYNYLPQPRFGVWEKEGISQDIMIDANIRLDPKNWGILIPHYNIDNKLVGIRIRFLAKEDCESGKYKPAYINGELYNHPLSFNLYNINKSKEKIKELKKAIIFEGEKSCLQLQTMLPEMNIGVAVCGSNISSYQMDLLLQQGAEEVVIAFDKQFKRVGDEEWFQHRTLLKKFYDKWKNYVRITFMDDWRGDVLGYKSSPTDEGIEKFKNLWYNRKEIK